MLRSQTDGTFVHEPASLIQLYNAKMKIFQAATNIKQTVNGG